MSNENYLLRVAVLIVEIDMNEMNISFLDQHLITIVIAIVTFVIGYIVGTFSSSSSD